MITFHRDIVDHHDDVNGMKECLLKLQTSTKENVKEKWISDLLSISLIK